MCRHSGGLAISDAAIISRSEVSIHSNRRDLGLHGLVRGEALEEVARAVRLERGASIQPVPLRVAGVEPVDAEEGLWELEVEADVPLAEGTAWVGASLQRGLHESQEGGGTWQGQVLEVDAATSRLFAECRVDQPPSEGLVTLWPFDFLRAPWQLMEMSRCEPLRQDLRALLAAAAGEATGQALPGGGHPAWGHSWVLVWGPPGTGKTWTLGRQVAALLQDPSERVLVLSTTHRATDAAALELGRGCRELGLPLQGVERVGHVLRARDFRQEGLGDILPAPVEILDELEEAALRSAAHPSRTQRARARRHQGALRSRLATLKDRALDPSRRALVSTLYSAQSLVLNEEVLRVLEQGRAPFTTVVVDEAGLVSRTVVAVVSLLASRRVVLVGDPRQLSPISRAARTLPQQVMRWLARSGLQHLRDEPSLPHVQRLLEQRRMHPSIRAAISDLQYRGALLDHPSVSARGWPGAGTLRRLPRVVWIPVDAYPGLQPGQAASRRGPDGRSRVREASSRILRDLVQAQPELAQQLGLFISPFKAQAQRAVSWLREAGLTGWRASTVHAQQGAEAQVVVFDTVHASSTAWPAEEWCRLVNVGLSRARELLVLLASREEVAQPWMRPLRPHLQARVLRRTDTGVRWVQPGALTADTQASLFGRVVPPAPQLHEQPAQEALFEPDQLRDSRLGAQIERRRALRPVLSQEQRVLVSRDLADAGPRLVRGVAGSGKTLVLAHWVARTLLGQGFEAVGVFYANRALKPLIQRMLDEAWVEHHPGESPPPFPWERVRMVYVKQWLEGLLREQEVSWEGDPWDFEAMAARVLELGGVEARLDAAFVDEAQDLGHQPLLLVSRSVKPSRGRKPVLVFYDNAQNVYGRPTPRWKDFGLDMRGRSDIMRESFRTTRPVTELALNLVHALRPLDQSPDMRELMRHDPPLLELREGWWRAGFCSVDGEQPTAALHATREEEVRATVGLVRRLVLEEGVRPGDLRIVTLSKGLRERLAEALRPALPVPVRLLASQGYDEAHQAVVITTPHSFKGYDAEVVLVPFVDHFAAKGVPLVETLYVALTRARTRLHVSGCREGHPGLCAALEAVVLRMANS